MTICKYYQQGNCRFGDRCWNEHIDSSSSHHGESASPLRHYKRDSSQQHYYGNDFSDYYNRYSYHNPRYSPPPAQSSFLPTPQRSNNDTHLSRQGASFSFTKAYEEVTSRENNRFAVLSDHNKNEKTTVREIKNNEIESLKDDMMRWEMGKQWPFSCYAPFKICFPGFEDISPEELRWEYYDSKDSGALNIYIQNVSEHAEKLALKRNEIKNATPQTLEKLKSLQSGTKQQGSIFGNVQNKTSSQNIFGSKTVFGSEKPQQQNSKDPNAFGFSLSHVSEQAESLFRLPQFGIHNQVNVFGNSNNNTAMEISAFDSKDSRSGKTFLFGAGKDNSRSGRTPFFSTGKDSFTPSFAQQKPSNSDSSTGTSIGLCNNTDNSMLHQASDTSEFIYTDVKLLTKLEKEHYTSNAEKFVLGKIPAQPPPKEFCF